MDGFSSYGFRYRCRGQDYSIVIQASSAEEAQARIEALADAEFVGELTLRNAPSGDMAAAAITLVAEDQAVRRAASSAGRGT